MHNILPQLINSVENFIDNRSFDSINYRPTSTMLQYVYMHKQISQWHYKRSAIVSDLHTGNNTHQPQHITAIKANLRRPLQVHYLLFPRNYLMPLKRDDDRKCNNKGTARKVHLLQTEPWEPLGKSTVQGLAEYVWMLEISSVDYTSVSNIQPGSCTQLT